MRKSVHANFIISKNDFGSNLHLGARLSSCGTDANYRSRTGGATNTRAQVLNRRNHKTTHRFHRTHRSASRAHHAEG